MFHTPIVPQVRKRQRPAEASIPENGEVKFKDVRLYLVERKMGRSRRNFLTQLARSKGFVVEDVLRLGQNLDFQLFATFFSTTCLGFNWWHAWQTYHPFAGGCERISGLYVCVSLPLGATGEGFNSLASMRITNTKLCPKMAKVMAEKQVHSTKLVTVWVLISPKQCASSCLLTKQTCRDLYCFHILSWPLFFFSFFK